MVEAVATKHHIEPEIADLLADLKCRLERRFGERFVALYLFGSRARGDAEPDSDVDVAVILDQAMPRPFDITREILKDTYDLLLETGYYIQPWPLEKESLDEPAAHHYPRISRAVGRRDSDPVTEDLLNRARQAALSARTLLSSAARSIPLISMRRALERCLSARRQ